MKTIKEFALKYKHSLWIISYMLFYLLGFYILEHAEHRHYHVIHSWLDDKIPFCEYFIIPYLLWFFYIACLLYTSGYIGVFGQTLINKTFIMSQIQICLRSVIRDKYFAVLNGIHSTWINIDVGVKFLHGNPVASGLQKPA